MFSSPSIHYLFSSLHLSHVLTCLCVSQPLLVFLISIIAPLAWCMSRWANTTVHHGACVHVCMCVCVCSGDAGLSANPQHHDHTHTPPQVAHWAPQFGSWVEPTSSGGWVVLAPCAPRDSMPLFVEKRIKHIDLLSTACTMAWTVLTLWVNMMLPL